VDFVSVPTRDLAVAVAWYRDVLGLPVSEYTPSEVETSNLTLTFWNPEEQDVEFVPNKNGIALRVPDVAAAMEEARAAVLGIQDSGVCHMGFVKDPDGNIVILHRRYRPRG
jgi:catechol 2,3-dioxygenase-like lactoylglutathione lyase family enzyme